MIHVRRAGPVDARALAEILNAIIAQGGSTALTDPVTGDQLAEWMRSAGAIWHLAEDDTGRALGFQWVEPHPEHGPGVAQIATFARIGQTGLGIGSALFRTTKTACARAGYDWINAEIRADNAGGLAYYQSRGFEDYGRIEGYALGDGRRVDKVLKRFDLT